MKIIFEASITTASEDYGEQEIEFYRKELLGWLAEDEHLTDCSVTTKEVQK